MQAKLLKRQTSFWNRIRMLGRYVWPKLHGLPFKGEVRENNHPSPREAVKLLSPRPRRLYINNITTPKWQKRRKKKVTLETVF